MTADEAVEFVERLGRISATGGGVAALAGALADALDAPVLVEDAEHRPIATAGKGSLPGSSRPGNGLSSVPITAGSVQFGWLSTAAEDAGAALRLAASALAVELSRSTASGALQKRGFWERVVQGAFHDVAAIREEAAARGIRIAGAYVCIALEADAPVDLAVLATQTFRAAEAEIGIVDSGTQCVVLVPAVREIDAENARTAATLLPKASSKRSIRAAIAGGVAPSASLAEIATGIDCARDALSITRRLYGFGRVCAYDELGAYPLLYAGASAEEFQAFARRALAPLREYDDKHQTELERTLRTYFASGQNVKSTSEELAVHRHTVFYRLRQIGEITGRRLEDPHDHLTLRLAIAIHALID